MTRSTAGWIFLTLTAVTLLFHLALLLGAPWGGLTMGGRWPGVLPLAGRLTSLLSMLLLTLVGRAVAERAGLAARRLPGWAFAVAVLFQLAAALANTITPMPAERALWLPLILLQLACLWRIARPD